MKRKVYKEKSLFLQKNKEMFFEVKRKLIFLKIVG